MAVIVIGGMIGLGKSSVADVLGKHLGSEIFYEKVEGNRVLEKFYTASDEEIQAKRYPFLLQLEFLSSRYQSIKKALADDNNILDRSIYEDSYFLEVNYNMGKISDLERELYLELLDNMLEELDELAYKKAPDLMVYLKGSFETVMDRITKRGRGYELDPELVDYYRLLWEGYDEWIMSQYKASDILVIDMDEMDVVNRPEDAKKLCKMVTAKLKKVRGSVSDTFNANCELDGDDNVEIQYYRTSNTLSIESFVGCDSTYLCLDEQNTQELKDFLNTRVRRN